MVRSRLSTAMALAAALATLASGAAAAQASAAADHQPAKKAPADASAASGAGLHRGEGMFMLDYQSIPVPNNPTLDLLGFHFLNKVADGTYISIGAYAPLLEGEYGGFMAFDVGAHFQRRLWGRVFGNAGVAVGGGGGGKSTAHSVELSGTGGFGKAYAGLGYDFDGFSIGANAARMKFRRSAIDSTQLNVFVQIPFSYTVASFANFGESLDADARRAFGDSQANTLTLGLDNYKQIDPRGSNKSTIQLADLQFAHYLTNNTYWYASLGVGYRGMPLYNQLIGGIGYRIDVSPRISLHGQLGIGSGGYAPEKIDTGAGLLVYPKLSAEYAISRNLGLALTAGYMVAPGGSSKNHTFGAALHYHLRSKRDADGLTRLADATPLRGYRFSLLQQTATNVHVRGADQPALHMLTAQLDTMLSDHVYIPIRAGVAVNAYLGFPGYGEFLVGLGLQNKFRQDDRFQFFGQLLGGANVHGLVVQPGVGLNYSLNDRWALYASAGRTMATSSGNGRFRSNYAGLGLTYRFSTPIW